MPARSLTFDQIMKAEKRSTTGFDYLRLILAILVLCIHVFNISDHGFWAWLWQSWFAPFYLCVLPGFFILSGFLVAGSLFRNSIPQFLSLRAMRIFPALIVEVILSAMVLGLLLTTLPIREYLASPLFHVYFLTIIGDIHFTLPGVFNGRPVNLQLWTIPFELACYVVLVVLAVLGIVQRRGIFAMLIIAAALAMTVMAVHGSVYHKGWNVPGRMLMLCFLFGLAGYLFRSVLPYRASLFWACAVASYLFLSFPDLVFLAAAPMAYVTIYIGLMRLRPLPFGDLSYGIYLFHFPIARALYETGYVVRWEMLLPVTIILSGALAALSWHLVEKPVLSHKNDVLAFVASATAWISSRVPGLPRPSAPLPVEALVSAAVSEGAVSSTLSSPDEPRL